MGVCSPVSVSSDGSPSGSSASLGAPPASTLQKAQPLQALLVMALTNAVFAYQWLADGADISGTTASKPRL